MSVISFSIDLTLPAMQGMERDIVREFSQYISSVIGSSVVTISRNTQEIVSEALRNSEAWAALVPGGELSELLCIENSGGALDEIEKGVISSIEIVRVPISISGVFISGGLEINILDDSYREVLSITDGSYSTINGKQINWLEWLLFYGNSPVLFKGKLIRTQRGTVAASAPDDLVIPPAYAGIPNDNFLTRALKPLEAKLGAMIEAEVSRRV